MPASKATLTTPFPPVRIAVLMTCHNRRELTRRCLATLRLEQTVAEIDVYLVDDGSTDGTADAARQAWPETHIIQGDGTLFWNGGMRLAWSVASATAVYDYYLWLNDDVVVESGAIGRLVSEARALANKDGAVIISGSTRHPGTSEVSYGGQRRVRPGPPLRFILRRPSDNPVSVDTFSGNIVLVSDAAFASLGNLSPDFVHIFGDLDYGLRATVAGMPVYIGSGFFGECAGPDISDSSLDLRLGRIRRLLKRAGEERKVHARDWRVFVRRHSGSGAVRFLYSLSPYWRILQRAGSTVAGEKTEPAI